MRQQFITKFNEQLDTATANYTSTNGKVLDAVVDANRKVVDFAVKTVDAITNAVEIPALPAMPKMPVELPFVDRFELPEFPTAAEAGKRYISFVERAADLNRDLNERVVDMLKVEGVEPVVTTAAEKAPAARKTAAKKTAKKASARKAPAKK